MSDHRKRSRAQRGYDWLAARPAVAVPVLLLFGCGTFAATAGLTCAATDGCQGPQLLRVAPLPSPARPSSPLPTWPGGPLPSLSPVYTPGSAKVRVAPPGTVQQLPAPPQPQPEPAPPSTPAPSSSKPAPPPSSSPASTPSTPPPTTQPPPSTEPPTPPPTTEPPTTEPPSTDPGTSSPAEDPTP